VRRRVNVGGTAGEGRLWGDRERKVKQGSREKAVPKH